MEAIKEQPNYYTIFTLNLITCLVILLGEFFCFAALPRFPALIDIAIAAYRFWTVLIIIVTGLWFIQHIIFKLPVKTNIMITVTHGLIMFSHLVVITWDTYRTNYRF
jgi:hypothetical protein